MRLNHAVSFVALLGTACSSPTQPSAPMPSPSPSPQPTVFSRSGEGSATFELPAGVTRVRVIATAGDNSCHHFLAYVGQRLAVNDIIGSCSVAIGMTSEAVCNVVTWPRVDIVAVRPDLDHNTRPFKWTVEEVKDTEPSHCLFL